MMRTGTSDTTLITGTGKLDLDRLGRLSQRPRVFSDRRTHFWTDPHIAQRVLTAHLDPNTDDASRRPEIVDLTVSQILHQLDACSDRPVSGARVLDLGCGPGLYAEKFAAAGHRVTAVDISSVALEHARASARRRGLEIEYLEEDMLRLELPGPFDLVTVIYGEFCALTDSERSRFLRKVLGWLRPGGLFAFDVFTERYARRVRDGNDWYVGARGGFWAADRHLVLEQTFHYPERSASVARYTIVAEDGSWKQYNVWWRHYDRAEIRQIVASAGFETQQLFGSLWGEEIRDGDEWIGVFAVRT